VRCCASTRASHRLELLGLVGTVVRVKHYAGAVEGPWWGVAVAYDALPTHPPSHHEADDLAAAG
jgi:hypothetical protein